MAYFTEITRYNSWLMIYFSMRFLGKTHLRSANHKYILAVNHKSGERRQYSQAPSRRHCPGVIAGPPPQPVGDGRKCPSGGATRQSIILRKKMDAPAKGLAPGSIACGFGPQAGFRPRM